MANLPGISGDVYDLEFDLVNGDVKAGEEYIIQGDIGRARTFLEGYRMGREHKKRQIRNALGV